LLVPLGVVARALQRCERAQRRAGDVRPLRQHLQRGDQRVAPEQGVEAPRVALLDRRGGRVRPPLLGEDLVEAVDQPFTAPAVSPATIRFWNSRTSRISGIEMITDAGLIVPSG